MKNLNHSLIVFVNQIALCSAVVLLTASVGHGQPPPNTGQPTQNVKVVNTQAEPIPVTGSVNVLNPVTVSGSVNVSNPVTVSGSVTVSNPINVSGTVNVGNTVLFRPVIPEGAFSFALVGNVFGQVSEPTNYAITSITAFNYGSDLDGVQLFGNATLINVPCQQGTIQAAGPILNVRPGETVHLTFPQPFILRVGGPISCLTLLGGESLQVSVVGYRF
jgi:hypothetical protein